MCLKNKIIAAALCGLVAGIGIFGTGANSANIVRASEPTTTPPVSKTLSIEQLQQTIYSLMQQIQQIIALIAQLKPQETCGNGICRFGETAASCPADCANPIANCVKEGFSTVGIESEYKQCCAGLSFISGAAPYNGLCSITPGGVKVCANCGDGICGPGENKCNCLADCAQTTACVGDKQSFLFSETNKQCCTGLEKIKYLQPGTLCSGDISCYTGYICKKPASTCGNGVCESGENVTNCPMDCNTNACIGVNEGREVKPGQSCCAGLSPLVQSYSQFTESWTCHPMSTPRTVCAKCGDGICGPGESYCDCPRDCCTPGAVSGCKVCQTNPSQVWKDDNSKCTSGQVCNDGACISSSNISVSWAYPDNYYATLKEGEVASNRSMYMLGIAVATGNSAVTLKKITFNFGNDKLSDFLKTVYVYQGGLNNLIATNDVTTTGNTLEITGLNVTIPANYSQTFVLQADVVSKIAKILPWNIKASIPVNSIVAVDSSGKNLSGPAYDQGTRSITFNQTSTSICGNVCKAAGFESGTCNSNGVVGNYTNYGYASDCIQTVCWCKSPARCGDNLCENGETVASCPADCKPLTVSNSTTATQYTNNPVLSATTNRVATCQYNENIVFSYGSGTQMYGNNGYTLTATINNASSGMHNFYVICQDINNSGIVSDAIKITFTVNACGNGICEAGETAASCPQDCCKPQVNEQIAILQEQLAALNAQSSQNPSATTKNQLAEQIAILQSQLSSLMTSCAGTSVCGNGKCETGENTANCAKDCGTTPICYGEGQGAIGMTSGTAKPCCTGLTARRRTTCSGTICSMLEGFICSK